MQALMHLRGTEEQGLGLVSVRAERLPLAPGTCWAPEEGRLALVVRGRVEVTVKGKGEVVEVHVRRGRWGRSSKLVTDSIVFVFVFVLYCIAFVLHCIVFYCIALHCVALYCIVLYCIVLYCIVLYCIVLYCIVLYCIVLYCIVLYYIVLHCIVLYCNLYTVTSLRDRGVCESQVGFNFEGG